ncbi:MAG: phage baseplate assembly protein V [Kiritimatiellales bacterium]
MNDPFEIRELQRRVANLVMFGTIEAVTIDGPEKARASVRSGGLVTAPLPWTAGRMGNRRDWSAPVPGEQVLVICHNGDPAQGVIAGSLGSDTNPNPSGNPNVFKTIFADGSFVQVDLDTHEMSIGCKGKLSAAADGDLAATTGGKATVEAVGPVRVDSLVSAAVTAPQINLVGAVFVNGTPLVPGGDSF